MDVLVVGAGPTGLSLAAELVAHGITPRLIDRGHDRVHDSRALAIQPRTLETLDRLGIAADLVAAGNPAVQLRMHVRGRTLAVPLFDLGLDDTAYPYLLFLSQAETERVLERHLAAHGVDVGRDTELVDLCPVDDAVTATLRRRDGSTETVTARYVVGCDGAHSTVRHQAGIPFRGSAYPQTFVLADCEVDGIEPGAAHAFLSGRGLLFFFPLGHPASWRLLAMRSPTETTSPDAVLSLSEVQAITDAYTHAAVRLRDPVWMTNFRLHNRGATHYRAGRVFLAGDAAHIHSPAGAQGMNTGIQDAANLGWKLAHTLRGLVDGAVLDTYEAERAPVGRTVLRFTDRAFRIGTSTNPLVRFIRTQLVPAVLPIALKATAGRAYAFRTLSQLGIHYRRSPLSYEGDNGRRRRPRAGDRLPDSPIIHNGQSTTLHRLPAAHGWRLLVFGGDEVKIASICHRFSDRLTVHHLGPSDDLTQRRLGLAAQVLVRPDGYVGYRTDNADTTGLAAYLHQWLPSSPASGER